MTTTNHPNTIEFEVSGKLALFSDPMSKIGGELFSYHIPTYEALKGICESIYWKPSIKWVIDDVRVLNPIQMRTIAKRPMALDGKSSLSYNTYLTDVRYQVRAHFIKNEDRPDLFDDYKPKKHLNIALRSLKNGGRKNVVLGTSECFAYVEPQPFGSGDGYYDNYGEMHYGLMHHSFNYPNKNSTEMSVNMWLPVMQNGYIEFLKPYQCTIVKPLDNMPHGHIDYTMNKNYKHVDVEHDELGDEQSCN